jgi:hypothetical protein
MDRLNNTLSVLRTNPYVSSSVSLFLVLYAGLAAPSLPASVAGLFEHSVFKLLILTLVLVLLKGQNMTMALLVSIGFVVSMGTLSRYRVSAMANELSSLNPFAKRGPTHVSRDADPSFGPDGQSQSNPSNEAKWSSKDGVNRLNIRGYEYAGHDETNHLPGGHGNIDKNSKLQVAAPLHPDGKFSGAQDPDGYNGHSFATIGTPDSQL